jgi:hypothetical protein
MSRQCDPLLIDTESTRVEIGYGHVESEVPARKPTHHFNV